SVVNNFVSHVMNENTGNAFNQTTSAAGIRIGNAGSGHEIFHNSVHLSGIMNGSNGAALTSALIIGYAGTTDMVIRNNIFSNQISGGHTSSRHVSIAFLASLFSNYRLTIDNNAYFSGTAANSRLAQVGLSTGQGEYHAENFSSSDSSNSTNLRTYTYSLTSSSIHEN